jgi:CRISPR-associated protein Cmr5
MSQTLEQSRAKYSYEMVEIIANDKENTIDKNKFKSLVKKAPTLILTNGLGNTMAFLFSKGKNEHLALAYIIGRYLFKENEYTKGIFSLSDEAFKENFESVKENLSKIKTGMQNPIFQNLVFTDTDKYILATEETLRLLNWLKRFVEAMIEDEKDKKEEV